MAGLRAAWGPSSTWRAPGPGAPTSSSSTPATGRCRRAGSGIHLRADRAAWGQRAAALRRLRRQPSGRLRVAVACPVCPCMPTEPVPQSQAYARSAPRPRGTTMAQDFFDLGQTRGSSWLLVSVAGRRPACAPARRPAAAARPHPPLRPPINPLLLLHRPHPRGHRLPHVLLSPLRQPAGCGHR